MFRRSLQRRMAARQHHLLRDSFAGWESITTTIGFRRPSHLPHKQLPLRRSAVCLLRWIHPLYQVAIGATEVPRTSVLPTATAIH